MTGPGFFVFLVRANRCRSHVPVVSGIVWRVPHPLLLLRRRAVELPICWSPEVHLHPAVSPSPSPSPYLSGPGSPPRASYHLTPAEGGLVDWQLDSLKSSATRLCRGAGKQDVARTRVWQCAPPTGHTSRVCEHLPSRKGKLARFKRNLQCVFVADVVRNDLTLAELRSVCLCHRLLHHHYI